MVATNHTEEKTFGKIVDNFRCFGPNYSIFNQNSVLKYKISSGNCQYGLICNIFNSCYEIKFYIYNADTKNLEPENSVGCIVKKQKQSENLMTNNDNFEIYFPSDASAQDKLNIIGAALMINYSYFEADTEKDETSFVTV